LAQECCTCGLRTAAPAAVTAMSVHFLQIWLLCGARLFTQACRLSVGGLLPLMAVELGLDAVQRGRLLAAFPLGYLLTQVLGGAASDRFGGKPVIGLGLVGTALGVMLYVLVQRMDGMMAAMFVIGLLQGPSFPTNGVMLSRWVPRSERALATAISDAGGPAGGIVGMFCVPALASWIGWRGSLGACGIATLLFAIVWQLLAANEPSQCSYLGAEEAQELRVAGLMREPGFANTGGKSDPGGFSAAVRLLAIPSAWSVFLAASAFNYNRYLLYNWLVTFYTDVLKAPVAEASMCMLLPNMVDAGASIAVGAAADALVGSGRLSALQVRRLFGSVGFVVTGVAAVLLAQAPGTSSATMLVTMASAAQACHNAGFKSSYAELSRDFCGLLGGVGNMLATGSSFLAPLVAAALLDSLGGSSSREAWQAVFTSSLLVGLAGAVAYSWLVSTEVVDDLVREGTGRKKVD